MKYKPKDGEKVRTTRCTIASATEISAGDLVAIDSGLIIKAVAASTAIGWTPQGSEVGDTVIEVSVGNDFTLVGTGDAVFAVSYKGGEYDINDTTQTIDFGASSTDVLKVSISESAGTVDSASNIEVKINKPLF